MKWRGFSRLENTWEPIDNLKSDPIRYYFVYYLLAYFAYVCGGWEGGAIIWIGAKTIMTGMACTKVETLPILNKFLIECCQINPVEFMYRRETIFFNEIVCLMVALSQKSAIFRSRPESRRRAQPPELEERALRPQPPPPSRSPLLQHWS